MLPIIDRYLLRELFKAFFAVTTVLVLVLLANNFVRFLSKVAAGELGSDLLLALLGLELLKVLGFLIPPAFFFAILISLGRLYRDSEMTALSACGVGPFRIYRTYLTAALPVALLVSWLVMMVLPWAKIQMLVLTAEQDAVGELSMMGVGKFQEFEHGGLVFFAESENRDNGRLRNVFIQNRESGKLGIIAANEGYRYVDEESGDHFVVLLNGHRYEGSPGEANYRISQFGEYGLRIRRSVESGPGGSLPMSARSTVALWQSKDINEMTELQYRISFSLAVFAFALVSVPLSRSMPRQGIYGRLFMAILVYFIFMNFQRIAESWMEDGLTPVWMGMWWVPLMMVVLAAGLEARDYSQHRWKWKPQWRSPWRRGEA